MKPFPNNIDLHMHSTVSDGTDTPEELLARVKEAGISLFSVTDHDAIDGGLRIRARLRPGDPAFLTGVEFSCKDEDGQDHILGYGYDPDAEPIRAVVQKGHALRMEKLSARLRFLEQEFGFTFPEEALETLYATDNPGKPHIGNLMVKLGYAKTRDEAIRDYINRKHFEDAYVRPEEAIAGIVKSRGIPVLAHPPFGNGDQLILGDALNARVKKLIGFGLSGVEAFYSGFTDKLRGEVLALAKTYGLYVTAGSDYHGKNRMIALGDTGMNETTQIPQGLTAFLQRIKER